MIKVRLNTRPTKIALLISTLILAASPLAHAKDFKNYNKPLVVDNAFVQANGNVITGDFVGTTSTPALTITATTPVTVVNSTVTGPADLIYGDGIYLTLLNTIGTGTNPNVYGSQKGRFLHIEQVGSLDMENCTVTGTSFGVYINRYVGNFTHSQGIRIINNIINNVDGRLSDGNGGYIPDGDYNAHAFQLNQVVAVPYVEIAWNQVINTPFQSSVNDQINIYVSSGTKENPIRIHDNYLQGAYPANPGVDSYSGGGIITDGGTNDTATSATSWVNIYNNQVVSTANYGISIAAGNNNNAYKNRVVSSGFISTGAFIPMTYSNGLNNYNNYNQPATTFFNNLVQNNLAGLIAGTSGSPKTPRRSDHYLPGQGSSVPNTWWLPDDAAHPTLADEGNELSLWNKKLKANKMLLGATKK
jgi:hypothetical protein